MADERSRWLEGLPEGTRLGISVRQRNYFSVLERFEGEASSSVEDPDRQPDPIRVKQFEDHLARHQELQQRGLLGRDSTPSSFPPTLKPEEYQSWFQSRRRGVIIGVSAARAGALVAEGEEGSEERRLQFQRLVAEVNSGSRSSNCFPARHRDPSLVDLAWNWFDSLDLGAKVYHAATRSSIPQEQILRESFPFDRIAFGDSTR